MTPEQEVSTEVHKTRHRWIDISVAVCALVVSMTSLWVAVRHGHTMERMAEANARLVSANSYPLLQHFQSNARNLQSLAGAQESRVSSLNVVNSGVGPAKIHLVELLWNGSLVRGVRELLVACCQLDEAAALPAGIETSDLEGMMLRAGDIRRLLVIPRSGETEELAARFHAGYGRLSLRACYCSVFDECWISDLETLHPEAVAQCPKRSSRAAGAL
jgi:hypothetical protein